MWTVTYWSKALNARVRMGAYSTRAEARRVAKGYMTRNCFPIVERHNGLPLYSAIEGN